MTAMYRVRVGVLVLAAISVSPLLAEEIGRWDYPAGRAGVAQVSAGKGGQLRVYDCETSDSIEQVVIWYFSSLGLDEEHRLLQAARDGFETLSADTHFQHGFGFDTQQRKDDTQMVAHLAEGQAHVSFLHRPDVQQAGVVLISIAEIAGRTSVHVVELPSDGDE